MAGNMEWAIRGTPLEYGNWLDTVGSAETPRVICHAASRCLEGDRPVRQCRWDEAFDEGIGVEGTYRRQLPIFRRGFAIT
jgi:hypothetical protein